MGLTDFALQTYQIKSNQSTVWSGLSIHPPERQSISRDQYIILCVHENTIVSRHYIIGTSQVAMHSSSFTQNKKNTIGVFVFLLTRAETVNNLSIYYIF